MGWDSSQFGRKLVEWIDRDWENAGYSPAASLLQPVLWITPALVSVGLLYAFGVGGEHWLTIAAILISLLMGVALIILSFCRLYIALNKKEQSIDGMEAYGSDKVEE